MAEQSLVHVESAQSHRQSTIDPMDLHFWSAAVDTGSSQALSPRWIAALQPLSVGRVRIDGSFVHCVGSGLFGELLRNMGRLGVSELVLDSVEGVDLKDLVYLLHHTKTSETLKRITFQRIRFCKSTETLDSICHFAEALKSCRALQTFVWHGFTSGNSVRLRPAYDYLVGWALRNIPHVVLRSKVEGRSPVSGVALGHLLRSTDARTGHGLTTLEISYFRLQMADWNALSRRLAANLTCHTLKIRGTVLSVPAAQCLVGSLRNNRRLEVLDLRETKIAVSSYNGLVMDYQERENVVWGTLLDPILMVQNSTLRQLRLDCRSSHHGMSGTIRRNIDILLHLNQTNWRQMPLDNRPSYRDEGSLPPSYLLSNILGLFRDMPNPTLTYKWIQSNLDALFIARHSSDRGPRTLSNSNG